MYHESLKTLEIIETLEIEAPICGDEKIDLKSEEETCPKTYKQKEVRES